MEKQDKYEIKLIEWPHDPPNPRNKYWIVEYREDRGTFFPIHGPYDRTKVNKLYCENLIEEIKRERGLR